MAVAGEDSAERHGGVPSCERRSSHTDPPEWALARRTQAVPGKRRLTTSVGPPIFSATDLAAIVAKAHKEPTRLAVEVDQRKDSVGVAVLVRFRAPMPPGAVAVAGLKSGFGFQVGSRDGKLFRDSCGDFQTMSMVSEQVAGLYIPYGVTKHRKAGLYSLEIGVVLADPDGGDSLGHTDVKVALPRPRAWHKVDYLWPFISLCMAVVRADAEERRNPSAQGALGRAVWPQR